MNEQEKRILDALDAELGSADEIARQYSKEEQKPDSVDFRDMLATNDPLFDELNNAVAHKALQAKKTATQALALTRDTIKNHRKEFAIAIASGLAIVAFNSITGDQAEKNEAQYGAGEVRLESGTPINNLQQLLPEEQQRTLSPADISEFITNNNEVRNSSSGSGDEIVVEADADRGITAVINFYRDGKLQRTGTILLPVEPIPSQAD